jgi:hypothetical protein
MRTRRISWLASITLAAGLALGMAGAAHADPAGVGVVHNTQGEAGYFANDNGHTRFRDVQAQVGVTNGIKFLNGANAQNPGALGVELCDPNTGYAAQLGVMWDTSVTPARFVIKYGHGFLGNTTFADQCIQSGLISNPTPLAPVALNPVAGDQLKFEIYYNPTSRWFSLNACDLTQDVCRQAHWNDGWKNLYEFGIGAVTQQTALTAPASNFLALFSHTAANYYSSTTFWNSIFVPEHWTLKRSDFVNSSDQVVMSSNGSLDAGGHTFSLFNGSTSA